MQSRKILVIDDEPDISHPLAEYLKMSGYEPFEANSGIVALGLMAIHRFTAIITDINMPEIDGLQMISYIKSNQKNSKCPIFVVSGDLSTSNLSKVKQLGVADWLKKPFKMEEMLQRIKGEIEPKSLKILAYHPEMIDILAKSFQEVMEFYIASPVNKTSFLLKDHDQSAYEFNSIVAIFGRRCYGSLSVSLSTGIVRELTKNLFGTDTLAGAEDLVGEITNQVAGKLKTNLNEKELVVCIGLPRLMGNDRTIMHLTSGRTGSLEFEANDQKACLEFCLGNWLDPYVIETDAFKIFVTRDDIKQDSDLEKFKVFKK